MGDYTVYIAASYAFFFVIVGGYVIRSYRSYIRIKRELIQKYENSNRA